MKKTILIVDDDASVRQSLRKVLEGAGYTVVLAASGEEAASRVEREPTDLIMLDLGLPIMNGWDTFERITSRTPVLPLIIFTGQANQYDMAVAAGVGALMEKPLDATVLLDTIKELLTETQEARLRRLCGYSQSTRHIRSAQLPLAPRIQERYSSPGPGGFIARLGRR